MTLLRFSFLGSLIAMLALACSSTTPVGPTDADAAIVVVARRIMSDQIFRSAAEIPVCIGETFERGPGDYVLAQLSKGDQRIRPCGKSFDKPVYVMIRSVQESALNEFVIGGGYYCGLLCADHKLFTVRKEVDTWVIVEEKFIWIS